MATSKLKFGLFSFNFKVDCNVNDPSADNCFADNRDNMAQIWHQPCGHLNYNLLKRVYMKMPNGFEIPGKTYKVKKIYLPTSR